MNKKAKNALIGTGLAVGAAALAAAVSYHVTNFFVKVALDREQPKVPESSKNRLAGSAPEPELMEMMAANATRLKNCGAETVAITARDGTPLVGHFYRCENARRVLVAMHGWRSSWANDFGVIADFWHGEGCHVLYAEQRGQGESGGDYMGFGLTERFDCLDWVHWVNENGGDLPVYLCGISMGASTVLMAAGQELPGNVRGIVADCGYTSPQDIWRHVMRHNLHLSYNDITAAIADDMCKKKIQVGAKDYSCPQAMRACRVPVLFIHGTDDRFVPVTMTYENYKACAAPKRLLVVPGAGHGMSYLVDQAGYEQAVRDFWRDYDTSAPGAV